MIVTVVRNFVLMVILIFIVYSLLEQSTTTTDTYAQPQPQQLAEVKTETKENDIDDLYKFVFQNKKTTQQTQPVQQQHMFRPYDVSDSAYASVR